MESRKAQIDCPEPSVIPRVSNAHKITLRDIARERVDIISEKMHHLPDQFLQELKNGLRVVILLGAAANGSQHRGEFFILKKLVQNRSDLTANTLIRAHRVQLEILVAINTGVQGFLHPSTSLSRTALIEMFVYKRCINITCQNQLPPINCTCEKCVNGNGFCNICMCVICSKFRFERNTCGWIECEYCCHWSHTDCAILEQHVYTGVCTKKGAGPGEMVFRCQSCNSTSDLLGWVNDVFQLFAESWDGEALIRELDIVSRMFRGSTDPKGKKLFWKCDDLKQKLESAKVESNAACREILMVFQDADADVSSDGYVRLDLESCATGGLLFSRNQSRRQVAAMKQCFFDQGLLDEQFIQLEMLQDDANPNFIEEIVTFHYRYSWRLISSIEQALKERNLDFNKLDTLMYQFKGSSSSIGAKEVKAKCNLFRKYCRVGNAEGCMRSFQQLKKEHGALRKKLKAYFQLARQAVIN